MEMRFESRIPPHKATRRLLAFACVAVIFWAAVNPASGQETNAARTVEQLRQQIEAHLAQPKFSEAIWGIKIISFDTGKLVFEHHADRLMSPASNSKLYTGALALDRLGGQHQISTPVYATGTISRSGTLNGDLVIVGQGDPSWNARRLGTNFWAIFEPFVTVLTNAGVHQISGDVIADATFFRGRPTGSSWTIEDLGEGEAASISAMTLNDNLAQLRVEPGATIGAPCRLTPLQPGTGLVISNRTVTAARNAPARLETFHPLDSNTIFLLGQMPMGGTNQILDLAVLQPADWFAAALKLALARHGITVSGQTRGVVWPQATGWDRSNAVKLGEVHSPPLHEVVRAFMKPSQNLETDLLLAHVGEMTRASNAPPQQTSEEAGLAALAGFLAAAGVPAGEVQFDEGSGLSRNNLTTANSTVALLLFMGKHREAKSFISALPIAGVDGTLRRRMLGTPAARNVRAKTGTLRWANTLSGYVTSAAGEKLIFSLMLNRYVPPEQGKRTDELDNIAEMLARFSGRTDESLASQFAPLGSLIVTQFVSAPFPHPARANGHRYHDEFFSAAEHYSDSTVAMFIPSNFRATDKVDFVVHFHGWRHTVAGTLEEYHLAEQLAESGKNAILIVPQGPRLAPDSFDGKLEDTNGFKVFMAEAMKTLRARGVLAQPHPEIGNVVLSAHSGGYHAVTAIVDHGGLADKIREVWLFDALYGGAENIAAWQKSQNGRLLDIYTDHGGTKEETEKMMASFRAGPASFFASEDTNAPPQALRTNRLVFLHTDMPHNDVVAKRGTFGEFLRTSCLENR
jgi:D-alanyl-D-alanine carboxypeptidase/D-alanyl-D-alanine-endopeptidase (penicillin-binding protein 4)